jgi:uncharacterized membrane protein YfcA
MDGFVLGLFLFAAFLGGFASGLAGFAMGFVVSGIWLHIITPIQTTALIAGYGLCTQGYGVWKLRQTLNWRTVAPFIIGGTIGVPLGAVLLTYLDPATVRFGVGVLLVIYCVYGLAKPAFKPHQAGAATDGGIGFLNGVLGGLTGLPGFVITVWCQVRGWTKDEQRAVFQPVILAGMMMIAISLSVAGAITPDTLKLYVLGLPALLAGLWLGFKCYGKLDDATFRKLVLVLLLCSGVGADCCTTIGACAGVVARHRVRADIACACRRCLQAETLGQARGAVRDASADHGTAMDSDHRGRRVKVCVQGRLFRSRRAA